MAQYQGTHRCSVDPSKDLCFGLRLRNAVTLERILKESGMRFSTFLLMDVAGKIYLRTLNMHTELPLTVSLSFGRNLVCLIGVVAGLLRKPVVEDKIDWNRLIGESSFPFCAGERGLPWNCFNRSRTWLIKEYDSADLRQELLNRGFSPLIPWRKNVNRAPTIKEVADRFGVKPIRWVAEKALQKIDAFLREKARVVECNGSVGPHFGMDQNLIKIGSVASLSNAQLSKLFGYML